MTISQHKALCELALDLHRNRTFPKATKFKPLQKASASQNQTALFSTGLPELDELLGGGLPRGRIVEVYGHESSGKSTLALQLLARTQTEGKIGVLVDADRKFEPSRAQTLGCCPNSLLLYRSNQSEAVLNLVQQLVAAPSVGMVVVDSTSNLIPDWASPQAISQDQDQALSSGLARVLAAKNRANSQTIVLFLSQMRRTHIPYGRQDKPNTPLALAHAASTRIHLKRIIAQSKRAGLEIEAELMKSAHTSPMRIAELNLNFKHGFQP